MKIVASALQKYQVKVIWQSLRIVIINLKWFMVRNKSALDVGLLNGGRKMFDEKDIISKYTMDNALDDGVFVLVGVTQSKIRIVFTSNLFSEGYEDFAKRDALVKKGLLMFSKPDKEDTNYMRLRVIVKDKIWVIHNGEGITFMKPEDY